MKNRINTPTAYVNIDNDNAVHQYICSSQSQTLYFDHGYDIIGGLVDFIWSLLYSNIVISEQLSFQRYRAVFTACSIVRWEETSQRTVGW